jgi:RHS repeat-associated protein
MAEGYARFAAHLHKQYVWGIRYIDAPILRDRETDGGAAGLDERLYYTQDGNFNVTALVNTDGTVAERIIYSPYGQPTFLKADWTPSNGPDGQNNTPDDGTASDFHNAILYCGYRFDSETGLYHVRHRYLHPTLGRWTTQDPAGYVDGLSLYEYCRSGPVARVDAVGTESKQSKGVRDSGAPERIVHEDEPWETGRFIKKVGKSKGGLMRDGTRGDLVYSHSLKLVLEWEVLSDDTYTNITDHVKTVTKSHVEAEATSRKEIKAVGDQVIEKRGTERAVKLGGSVGSDKTMAKASWEVGKKWIESKTEGHQVVLTSEKGKVDTTKTSSTITTKLNSCQMYRNWQYQLVAKVYLAESVMDCGRHVGADDRVRQDKDTSSPLHRLYHVEAWTGKEKLIAKVYLSKFQEREALGHAVRDADDIKDLKSFKETGT